MARRATKPTREDRIDDGVALLLQTLEDLLGPGLARASDDALPTLQRRLVDAQASGLAAQVGQLALEPDPERLVWGLGRLVLLGDAWRARDHLPEMMRHDLFRAVGIATRRDAVLEHGDVTRDDWLVLGAISEHDESRDLRTTRTWLRGTSSGRSALLLTFAAAPEARLDRYRRPRRPRRAAAPGDIPTPAPGTAFTGALSFWPGAWPTRALVLEQDGDPRPVTTSRLPGRAGIAELLDGYAELLAHQPLARRMLVVLGDVRITPPAKGAGDGQIIDGALALPFSSPHGLTLLAISGGEPIDVVAEYDGEVLTPLAALGRDGYTTLDAYAKPSRAKPAPRSSGPPHAVARAALVGAPARLPASGSGLDALLPASSAALTLLRRGALIELARRAGRVTEPPRAPPEPAPPDTRRPVPAAVAAILAYVLRTDNRNLLELHHEIFPILAARGDRLPGDLVAPIMTHPRLRGHPDVPALVGARGAWLQRFLPRRSARRSEATGPGPEVNVDWRPGVTPTAAHARALKAMSRPFAPEVGAFVDRWIDRATDTYALVGTPLGDAMVAIALGIERTYLPRFTARVPALYKNFQDALVIAETRRRFHEELERARATAP